ncbi:MAG: F0F1 ATP synthase subunit delta [Thermomicrobiales bacterium]
MASGAARRYVQAIVELAREEGSFDTWERDLGLIAQLGYEPSVVAFLENPSVHDNDKIKVVDGAITDVSPQARNLVLMLIDRRRTRLIPDIVELFEDAIRLEKGIVMADVTTADPIDGVAQEIVKRQLREFAGRDVALRLHTDEAIIGGVVARIGDQVIDGSVVNQLRRLRARLSAG